ncbi:MAG: methyltransferase domain-containing protein [Gammaproteobacteria bacterium]
MSKLVWNRAASSYEDVLDGQYTQAIGPILDAALVQKGTKLLDVGTGPGSIAATAHLRGALATGIDYAESMIATACEHHPEISFSTADATNLPFSDSCFDAVVMGFTLFLIPEPESALQEAYRVLERGGRLAFTVWDGATPGHGVFGMALAKHTGQGNPFGDLPLMGVNDHSVLRDVTEQAGFGDIQIEELPIFWELNSADQLFDAFAPMYDLSMLSQPQVEGFHRDVESNAEPFRQGEGYLVPFPALLASGKKF